MDWISSTAKLERPTILQFCCFTAFLLRPTCSVTWGKNDYIFPVEGAYPYRHDLQKVELHLLNTGHFALEEEGEAIAHHIRRFFHSQSLT